ncbi:MAG: bifunctional adenosylcobinamide kinase/adenosylcobinamide-phosphate guanylyltransferase [Lachnospiraceae bacterium]
MILLVTGGSASGKSEYAENRALQLAKAEQKKLIYLAAMKPFGEEAAKRIERHRQLRAGKGFETVERYTDIEGLCRDESLEAETFNRRQRMRWYCWNVCLIWRPTRCFPAVTAMRIVPESSRLWISAGSKTEF